MVMSRWTTTEAEAYPAQDGMPRDAGRQARHDDTEHALAASIAGGADVAELRREYLRLREENARLREANAQLEVRVRKSEERRRAMIHIMDDLNSLNRKLADQRKAMIHIMSDLSETTAEVQRREQELRDKQEQLVQAAKLATLGELTTGVAHELNNPLNNIGLFIGNVIDRIELGAPDREAILRELANAMRQVRKATEIISHLRTFGRAAPVSHEPVELAQVIRQALSLMQEQLRLRQIEVSLDLPEKSVYVQANAIQLEQVFINLLTNARDALTCASTKRIQITCARKRGMVDLTFSDTGPGIPPGLEQRIFDPFFTTKDVGTGTGLGLSITYGIIKEHQGSISVMNHPGEGATFLIQLPLASDERGAEDVFV